MKLSPGSKIGAYEILAFTGAGGMGEVYRARDSRIGREVAIKILPQEFSANNDRLRRFQQEAQAVGMLNHPNILSIYDLGTEESRPYLVCELLEGETLRNRLQTGRIPYRKAVEYAIQTASGLTAAHEKGIAHRDLKPENIFIMRDGRVKILDFGLAKLSEREPLTEDRSQSQVQTMAPQSIPGIILGTVGYMAPEQVRGLPSDHRADIFAFGTILYEMMTGKRAFQGDTSADTLSAILQTEPRELSHSQADLPQGMVRLLQYCLEKNPAERLQSIRDVRFYLETLSGLSDTSAKAALPAAPRPFSKVLPWLLATVFAAAAIIFAVLMLQTRKESQQPVALSIQGPIEPSFNATQGAIDMALSPDGKHLIFPEQNKNKRVVLWDRELQDPIPRPLAGTEDATYPFWSPDGRYVGFFSFGDSKLKVIDIQTGVVRTLCDVPAGRGGTWSREGTILFAPDKFGGLYSISSSGGKTQLVTDKPPEGITYRWPCFLPDNRHFLFTSWESGKPVISIGSLDSKDAKVVLQQASNAIFTPPDLILFVQDGTLVMRSIDLKSFQWKGEALNVVNQSVVQNLARAFAGFTVSESGVLAYQADLIPPSKVLIVDRSGKTVEQLGEDAYYQSPRFSPDGKRISILRSDLHTETADIWLIDRAKGTTSRFTSQPALYGPAVWSAAGDFIYTGHNKLSQKASSGASAEQVLHETAFEFTVTDSSSDGNYIAIALDNSQTLQDVMAFSLKDRKLIPYIHTASDESGGKFSPDGKYFAYVSDESGRSEIYVRTFPDPAGGKWQVSTGGGSLPVWNRNGKELFYLSSGAIMAVPVSLKPVFDSGKPEVLFFTVGPNLADDSYFDVSPDGNYFVLSTPPDAKYFSSITVSLNWKERLTRHR